MDLSNASREEIEQAWAQAVDEEAMGAQIAFCDLHKEFLDDRNAAELIRVLIRQAHARGDTPQITFPALEQAFGELCNPADDTDTFMLYGVGNDPRNRVSLEHIKETAEAIMEETK